MHLFVRATLVAALAVGVVTVAARAQDRARDRAPDQASAPDPGGDDDTKPYVPPAASKSVEVGNYYFRKKRYNAALSRYEEATHTDPSYAPAYLGLGQTYEKVGLKHKALAAFQKYLDLLPSEKQADEAKKVHAAIARLERDLNKTGSAARATARQQAEGGRQSAADSRQ
jgi:tetratricopeptide (TPR) repeat protein